MYNVLSFQPIEHPLVFLVELVFWWWILCFYFSGYILISPSLVKVRLLDIELLVHKFSFFQCCDHPGENSVNLTGDPCTRQVTSLLPLSRYRFQGALCLWAVWPSRVWYGSLRFILRSSSSFLDVRINAFVKCETFGPLFLQILFLPLALSYLLKGLSLCLCWFTWWCLAGAWSSVHFSLFCYSWLMATYLSSKFTHSAFIQFKSSPYIFILYKTYILYNIKY